MTRRIWWSLVAGVVAVGALRSVNPVSAQSRATATGVRALAYEAVQVGLTKGTGRY
jgi:hypothetical protein